MNDIRAAIARADHRYSRRAGHDEHLAADHLDALALAIQPYVVPAQASDLATTVVQQRGQISSLERERDQLAEELRAAREDFERRKLSAGTAAETIARTMREKVDELRAELAEARAAPDAPEQPPHQHTYDWPSPATDPLPCACGHPYPRTALHDQLAHGTPVTPDREPFGDLMGQIRDELSTWGNPTKLKGVA